ncbi:MauE/DoxX family redox-associated membrane protein [Opitutus sp. ER46]|uniref:MauE/DoxX family redox-associated membrane protein n=1 Tax=Opitutus sp. ER46 TaxID=2161864 RepID=UPI000D2FE322|nr:MauE/DoxX family redox-associated membrane protein [Opitutus sp. ER46]PTX91722.1 hypothetical protein DB354_17830 [Opitutus sp. ER46]
MSAHRTASIVAAARLILGALFVYLGVIKVIDPVDFLKHVRDFGVVEQPPALNAIVILLPWFEIWSGALLLAGWKARATAALQLALLAGFTGLVFARAWALHRATGAAFMEVSFDCGCGTGQMLAGMKLLENSLLMILAAVVAWAPGRFHSAPAELPPPVV